MGFKMVIVPPNAQPDWPQKIRAAADPGLSPNPKRGLPVAPASASRAWKATPRREGRLAPSR